MRVLAVLYCYPPLLVPAAMCYAKLMLGLRAADIDVEIVVIDPSSFASPGPTPVDMQLKERLPDDIKMHVVDSPENRWWMQLIKRFDPQRRLSYRWLEPRKNEWVGAALKQLADLDLSSFDLLLTCGQPHANHLLGLELKKRYKLPWLAYFSDPWTDNVYSQFATPQLRNYHRQLEDRVLEAADRVLFTCEEMRQLLLAHHPVLSEEKSGVLPHAFIPEWYGDASPSPAPAGRELRILQTGSFYGPRTPAPLVDALVRISDRIDLKGRIRFDFYGSMDDSQRTDIEAKGLGDIIQVHGFVLYLESLALMRDCDALILIDAPVSSAEESVFLPSKLIDYLGAKKPIIAITPERGATARVVRETGGIVCPLESPESVDAFLLEILERASIEAPGNEEEIAAYQHDRVGASLATMMEECIRLSG
jgi:glycosyltransferase involved in cell wall biosynthesis